MSILNDLKRVFFGAKSVAKHQGGKAMDAAKEAGSDLADAGGDLLEDTKAAAKEFVDKAPEYLEKGKDALEDLTDKIWKDADAAVDKAKAMKDSASDAINSKLEDLRPKPEPTAPAADSDDLFGEGFELDLIESEPPSKDGGIDFESGLEDAKSKAGALLGKAGVALGGLKDKAGEVLGDINEKVSPTLDAAAHAGNTAKEKIGDVAESVGGVVIDKGGDILNHAAEVGASAKDKFDDFVDHANTEANKMRIEDTIEEAKNAAEQAEARARAFDGKEGARDTSESTLSGTGSFFDRAAKFADGDYTGDGTKPMIIKDNPDATSKPEGGIIAGFLDSDGDGDSLIDDAIIEEE